MNPAEVPWGQVQTQLCVIWCTFSCQLWQRTCVAGLPVEVVFLTISVEPFHSSSMPDCNVKIHNWILSPDVNCCSSWQMVCKEKWKKFTKNIAWLSSKFSTVYFGSLRVTTWVSRTDSDACVTPATPLLCISAVILYQVAEDPANRPHPLSPSRSHQSQPSTATLRLLVSVPALAIFCKPSISV